MILLQGCLCCRMLAQAGAGMPGPETFGDVLTPDVLESLLSKPGVAERLTEFLPDELQSQVWSSSTSSVATFDR